MSQNPILLALLLPNSNRSSLSRLIRKFLQAASWIDADLQLLLPLNLREQLKIELSHLDRSLTTRPIVENLLHENSLEETMSIIKKLSPDYLCFEDGDVVNPHTQVARLKQSLLAQATTAVLILPKQLPKAFPRFDSIVVPISGEQRKSEALRQALTIAHQTNTSVNLVHVSQSGEECRELSGLESVGDEIHHEYAHHLDKVVSEASPGSSYYERRRVARLAHLSGTTHDAILDFMQEAPRSLLVLEWKAVLVDGHAVTLKTLLKTTKAPILIVKVAHETSSKLKIDHEFKAV